MSAYFIVFIFTVTIATMEPDYVFDNSDGGDSRRHSHPNPNQNTNTLVERLLGQEDEYDFAVNTKHQHQHQQQHENQQHQHQQHYLHNQQQQTMDFTTRSTHTALQGEGGNGNGITGEKQPNQYRDIWAVILFGVVHVVLLYFSLAWGVFALDLWMPSSSAGDDSSLSGIIWLVMSSSVAAFFIAGGTMVVLLRVAHQLIQISLIATVTSSVALLFFFLSRGLWLASLASLVFVAAASLYAMSVWRRIPLAAANLQVAITAIQANGGLVLVAVAVTVVVNGLWSILWGLAWLGVYAHSLRCTDTASGTDDCVSHMNPLAVIALLLIYSWTAEVGKNIVHVTTAGVVGTFWFAPHDASTYCSPAVHDSFVRAGTFSLGSICFGSLLTSVLQVFHTIVVSLKQSQSGRTARNELLLCALDCVTAFLERLVAYFNQWAFVYIGLYGYDYLTAGEKVTELLVDRGWTAIINDNLVVRVLTLASLVIGAFTGVVGLLLIAVKPEWVDHWGMSSGTATAFFIPAVIGTAMANIMMSVVVSAVDTVVVAFAEAPLEFERNHPGLSAQLVAAWRMVYPEEYGR